MAAISIPFSLSFFKTFLNSDSNKTTSPINIPEVPAESCGIKANQVVNANRESIFTPSSITVRSCLGKENLSNPFSFDGILPKIFSMPAGRCSIFLKSVFVPVLNSGNNFGDNDCKDCVEVGAVLSELQEKIKISTIIK